jgi:hypothetical protein
VNGVSFNDPTLSDLVHQFSIGLKEVIFGQTLPGRPLHHFEDLVRNSPREGRNVKEYHLHISIRVTVAEMKYFLANLRVNLEFFGKFAPQGIFQIFTVVDLAPREFPLQAVFVGVMALADQNIIAIF